MTADLAFAAAFIEARLAEDTVTAAEAEAELAALPGGFPREAHIVYRLERSGFGLPYQGFALVHDPARVLRDVTAKRAIVGACTRAAEADPNSPAGVLALAVLEAMSTEWEHPGRPFVPDWTISPGVLLAKALEAQGKTEDSILGADRIIAGTLRIDAMHAHWIADELGTSADMWLNAQRLYDAAILRGAKDTSEEHEHDQPLPLPDLV